MKRLSKISQIFFTTLFALSITLQGIQPAAAQDDGGVRIKRNAHTGKVSFIGATPGKPINVHAAKAAGLTGRERAMAMVEAYAAEFGLKQAERELKLKKTEQLKGRQVTKFQQTYQDIPVMAGELVVDATDQGDLISLNGEIAPDLSLDTNPSITADVARETGLQSMAKMYQGKPADFAATEPELWIYDARLLEPDGSAPSLVWRMEVSSTDQAKPIRELVLVDAQRGNIALHFNQIDTSWGPSPIVNQDQELPTETATMEAPPVTDVPTEVTPPTDVPTETAVPPTEAATEPPATETPLPTQTAAPTAAPVSGAQMETLSGTIRYVATTGATSGDCISTPCQTINQAIGQATAGDTIEVASGTYTESVSIATSMALSGGWNVEFTEQTGWSTIDTHNIGRGITFFATASLTRFVIQHGQSTSGGGVFVNGPGVTVTIDSSTIRENVSSWAGGGIFVNRGDLTLSNSTVSSNIAGQGGGIYLSSGGINHGSLTIQNSTIANNHAESGGGLNQYSGSPGMITLRNSIVANNTATTSGPDCREWISNSDHNVIGKTSGCSIKAGIGDRFNINSRISSGPVGAAGYYALLSNSPAINTAAAAACPAFDQRGMTRPQGLVCDMGAYEYVTSPGQAASFDISAGSGQRASLGTRFALPLLVYVVDGNGSSVPGVPITFSAPDSGASGVFAANGDNSITVLTNAAGIATAALSANNQVGTYMVSATASGLPGSVDFSLTNAAWYVAPTGDDTNSCAAPGSPCLTMNAAVAKASVGETVYVASGMYSGTGTTPVVTLSKAVTLSGGWDSSFTEQSGVSVIDGENARQGVSISGNSVLDHFVIQHGYSPTEGGGIYMQGWTASATISNSTIRDNEAESAGGGIYVYDLNLSLTNSTVSNNTASNGAGVYVRAGTTTIRSSTIADNAGWYGGGLDGSASVSNSIIANNRAVDIGPDCYGTIQASDHNIIGKTSGCRVTAGTGDHFNVNARLSAALVGDAGYYTLLSTSPAINGAATTNCPLTDQRGMARPQGAACDIGAYEYAAPGVAASFGIGGGSGQRTLPGTTFAAPLAVYVVDANGNGVSGASVTLTAPVSGPSSIFTGSGSNSVTLLTDAGGVALAPLSANSQLGVYIVSATVDGLGGSADFALANAGWYVAPAGSDGNSCTAPDNACLTINGAIAKASVGQTIFVSGGTYTGTGTAAVVSVSKRVNLSGGWNAAFTAQDEASIIDGEDVRQGINVTASSTIDRFIVQHGLNGSLGGMAIFVYGYPHSFGVRITNSTFRDNVASYSNAIGAYGAILVVSNSAVVNNTGGGITAEYGTLSIQNSTIANNGRSGISVWGGAQLTILNSTIINNRGWSGGGVLIEDATAVMRNSILANNSASESGPDCHGKIKTSDHNIIGDLSDCTLKSSSGDQFNVAVKTGASLIGMPGYYPLLAGSPAIDAGNRATCLRTDQRGISRPHGIRCDIGAYEYVAPSQAAAVRVQSGSGQHAAPRLAFSQPLTVYVVDGQGSPVAGVTVTFTAPVSGPSGTFADSANRITTAITNSGGVAASSMFTANGELGDYAVTATITEAPGSATFDLTNQAWYVALTGSDSNTCAAPDSPCLTINAVVAKANAGGSILVAAGVYTGASADPVVTISRNVSLFGGWNETFTARDGISIIDGQGARRAVLVTTTARIDQLVIQHGYALGDGAGIVIHGNALQTITISNSSIRDNVVSSGSGAGIYQYDPGNYATGASLELYNSTVGGNSAPGGTGGGIYYGRGQVTIQSSTITNNSASVAGGLYSAYSDTVDVHNSILANNYASNRGPDCSRTQYGPTWNPLRNVTNSVIGNSGLCPVPVSPGNHLNVDPRMAVEPVGALGYYPILVGSPAIDGASASGCPATDVRGVKRPQGSACDIGAFEYRGGGTVAAQLLPLHGTAQYVVTGSPARVSPAAAVLDSNGDPVTGVQVTFTAPGSGPSGMFGNGENSINATTDSTGIAAPGAFVANGLEGSYTIQATVTGLSDIAAIPLINGAQRVATYTMKHGTAFSSLPGTLVCDLTQTGCTNGKDQDADQAEEYAYGTYLFYRSELQRNSLNNAGGPIMLSVHFGKNFKNSFWDGREVVLADGWAPDDVVAHELTHGVTQYTAGLFSYYQAGAINESLSDLFGELYDQSNGKGLDDASDKWLIGEEIYGGAIRSMSDPGSIGFVSDPDHMSEYNPSPEDNGGVHTNAGIGNKAAYLLIQGDTFRGKTVVGIGAHKAIAIYYEAQTHLLTSGSDYADLYDSLYQACLNLVGGPDGILEGDCQSVRDATDAVGMNTKPNAPISMDAPVCNPGLSPTNVFYDDFESGSGRWTFTSMAGTQRWRLNSPYGLFAHSGTHFLYADDFPPAVTDVSAEMRAGVKLPSNAYLHFAHAFDFEPYTIGPYHFDGGVLEYSTDGGLTWKDAGSLIVDNKYGGPIYPNWNNPLPGRKAFVGTSHGYISSRLNLASLAGKTVKFRWRMALDDKGYMWGWWLDDVRIYTCGGFTKLSPATGAIAGNPVVNLSWRSVGGATSYEYCVDKNDGACSAWTERGMATSATVSSLDPATTYYWQVRANTASGPIYADAGWWSFTTGPLPSGFGKLGPVQAAVDQTSSPLLSWAASPDSTGYEYCYDEVDNDACDETWMPTTGTGAAPSGLKPGTDYYWQVRAVNSFGSTDADAGTWFSFTTTSTSFAISGNTALDGTALTFIGSTANGDVNAVTVADTNGDYSLGLPPGWSGTVTPSKTGATFTPASYPYTNMSEDLPGQNYSATVPFVSVGSQDGWIAEWGENSSLGGIMKSADATLKVGDDADNQQARAILSFNTASLPDDAVITNARLQLTRQSITPSGSNPFTILNGLFIDMQKGFFSASAGLEPSDFQAAATKSGLGPFRPAPVGALYTINLPDSAFPNINRLITKGGVTQLRLRFGLDDNNDGVANLISFYSGNAGAANRPALVITYYVP